MVLVAAAAGSRAQERTGIRAELVALTDYAQEKILLLENATPEEKMTWRPSAEVRSISEVYSHVAYGNYPIGRIAGMALPEGLNLPPPEGRDKWEKAATDKKAIHDQLVKSFDFVQKGIASMPDPSLEKMVDFFGPQEQGRSETSGLDRKHFLSPKLPTSTCATAPASCRANMTLPGSIGNKSALVIDEGLNRGS